MPDIDPHGEGLAFVLFSVLLCLAVVFVWTGVEGFLGLRLRAIMIRWSVVTVVTALVLELAAIATGVVTAGLADLPVGLALNLVGFAFLLGPAAAVGGLIGGEVGAFRRRDPGVRSIDV